MNRADLGFELLPQLLGFVLLEVVHYHHGSIDLPHRHVSIWVGQTHAFKRGVVFASASM